MSRTPILPNLRELFLKVQERIILPRTQGSWRRMSPGDAGFDPIKLKAAREWLNKHTQNRNYRIIIVRKGYIIAEWNHGINPNARVGLASVAKSIYSCILGIAIRDGRLPSADVKIVDYYPKAFDVLEGEGPKPGRSAFAKDRDITFRQLISNTSGYMKPGEKPGKVFHYQTYGMNILAHAIAKIYGFYDIRNPEGSPGLRPLIDEKLRVPMAASWSYSQSNFDLPPNARINIFGYFNGIKATALDMARLGWLWCNWGRWMDRQLVPEAWLREATRTAPAIIANCPKEQWKYGYGFWTNDHSQLWPDLPSDSFAASGAGGKHIWVCPSLDLVAVQSPGISSQQAEYVSGFLKLIINALE